MRRVALGLAGVVLVGYGGWLLVSTLSFAALVRLPVWLGGAVLTDDFVLVPLTLLSGWLLTRWAGDRVELLVVRTTALYVAITTLIALPLLYRQGEGSNPTVLSRDYREDWLRLEAMIVTAGLAALMIRRYRRGRRTGG